MQEFTKAHGVPLIVDELLGSFASLLIGSVPYMTNNIKHGFEI